MSNPTPIELVCDICNEPTTDDTSELWESVSGHDTGQTRTCFDCVPPDEL